MRSHSSCLFHTGQLLLLEFDLCAPIRLVFFMLVSRCWWTLACAMHFFWFFPVDSLTFKKFHISHFSEM